MVWNNSWLHELRYKSADEEGRSHGARRFVFWGSAGLVWWEGHRHSFRETSLKSPIRSSVFNLVTRCIYECIVGEATPRSAEVLPTFRVFRHDLLILHLTRQCHAVYLWSSQRVDYWECPLTLLCSLSAHRHWTLEYWTFLVLRNFKRMSLSK